jgi:DNA-binding LacI/PurR family transcriptional regulator/ABC-type glycerol-3-phosphate transport system substrate-binding protein
MATIKDVSELAGVSIGTVSNYLNKTKPVHPDTAKRIADAIQETSYKPNYLAKNLRTKKYNDIGVLIPNFEDNYYIKVLEGIESVFRNTQYTINLALSYERKDYEIKCIETFAQKQICGLIVFTSIPDKWRKYYETFTERNIPLVLIDRKMEGLESSFVTIDNFTTILKLTSALIADHKQNLYIFTGPEKYFCESECVRGFSTAFSRSSIGIPQDHIVTSLLTKEDSFSAISHISAKIAMEKPDAIITTSENKARGIIESLLFLGYSQNEIPVITLGEEHWNKLTYSMASFSTLRPAIKLGATAATTLLNEIKRPVIESKTIVYSDRVSEEKLENFPFFSKKKEELEKSTKELNVLMLETKQTHALISILSNFTNSTGINAKISIIPHQKLLDRIMDERNGNGANDSADVIMYDIPWLETLIQNKLLTDITGETRKSDEYYDLFFPKSAEFFGQWHEKTYGLPFMYAPQILYYRKDLFEEEDNKTGYKKRFRSNLQPPSTWKEFNTITQFFTEFSDSIAYGTSFPAAYPECLAPEIYLRLFAFNNNDPITNSSINLLMNNQNVLKSYVSILRLLKFVKPNYLQANEEDVVKDFLNGETAMCITYPSFFNKIALQTQQVIKEEDIGYSEIPGGIPILGGWGLGISSNSTKVAESYRFIKWACMDTISSYFSVLGGFSAVQKTYLNDELIKIYPWFSLYSSSYKSAKPIIPPTDKSGLIIPQNRVDTIICKWVYKIINKEIDVQNAILNTQKELVLLL